MTTLIESLNERAHDPKRAIDEWRGFTDGKGKPAVFIAAPRVTEVQIAAAEARLGFPLPDLLRQLYLQVGNGGFGPGYGLYGIPTTPDDETGSVVGKYLGRRGKPDAPWPERLLPICTFGCGIESSLDCVTPETPVVRHDPNMEKDDVAENVPVEQQFDRTDQLAEACWVECHSFADWLQSWVDGKRLFYAAYGETGDGELEDDFDEADAEDDADEGEDIQ